MTIKTFYFNPYRECTYVLHEEGATDCIIIDCGAYEERERQRLATYIRDNQLTPIAHLITHAHPDHICGADFVEQTYGVKPTIYPQEGKLYQFTVLRTPGHKEDCVCYYDEKEGILFSGDTLFQESIGRTDLPGGNISELMSSLKRLALLPPKTMVYPGHGYTTTIEHELEYNPYL